MSDSSPLDRAAPERLNWIRVAIAWLLLLIWVGFIYATLGTVPAWREVLVKNYGEGVFRTLTFAFAGIALGAILGVMIFRYRQKRIWPYIALIPVLLFLRHVMLHWITIPVEQIHFIEYGLVGYLSYNALRHHLKGWGLVSAAIVLTYLFGMVDECIQGLLENRVGEQRDMYWNALAGSLAMAIVTFSLRPGPIFGPSGRREWRAHLMMLALVLPIQGFFNSAIAQFGVLIRDDAIGAVFRSRLDPEALRAYNDHLDHFRAEIAPRVGKIRMNEQIHMVHDRIHEEALVHAFRRAYHHRAGNYMISYKETLILDKYFPQFVDGTELDWPRAMLGELQAEIGDLAFSTYQSPVAEHLITSFSEVQMWVVIVILEGGVLFLIFRLSGRRVSETRGG